MSLRYDLGESRIVKTEAGMVYESVRTGTRVAWDKMIDAATVIRKSENWKHNRFIIR